jgi:hypothetical protein
MKTLAHVLKVMKTKKDGHRTKAEMATGLRTHWGSYLAITGNVQNHGKRRAELILWLPEVRGAIDEDNQREMVVRSRAMLGSFWSRTHRRTLRLSRVRLQRLRMRTNVGGAIHLTARSQGILIVTPSSTDGWNL